jgi:hypothetical protein
VPDVPQPKEGDNVTTGHSEPADAGELVTVARNLHDALMAARPYVVEESALENAGLGPIRGNPAASVLDQVDAAIADAGELLAGVTS